MKVVHHLIHCHARAALALTASLLFLLTINIRAADTNVTELDGQGLANRLATIKPTEESEVHGTINIRMKRVRRQIPFTSQVLLRGDKWQSVFQTAATADSGIETLVVVHDPSGGPNEYLYSRASSPTNTPPPLSPVDADKAATIPFARSDFTLAELGLDFLHWPMQQRLRSQTRLNRVCYVLESRNVRAPEIVRIRAFIDKEYAGTLGEQGFPALLVAEGYDLHNEQVKEFSLEGSSFKKVHGQYRLKQIKMENYKTGSQTLLKFDIPE